MNFKRALPVGTYLVRIYNNEMIIPLYQYANINNAYINVYNEYRFVFKIYSN